MRFTLPALVLILATSITASPISALQGADNACYYKRSLSAYVRRDPASNSEILCGKQKQALSNHARDALPVPPRESTGDNACYYKRDLVTGESVGYKRDANNAEILCGAVAARSPVPPKNVDNACYYKRDLATGKSVGYKRDANNAEILCGAVAARSPVPPKTADNACYYKRDLKTGLLAGYKRDANNAEILCGAVAAA